MKLPPPETAPKDGTSILAAIRNGYLFHAVFNVSEKVWLLVDSTPSGNLKICPFSHDLLVGWIPMPQAHDEGNVTWPNVSPA